VAVLAVGVAMARLYEGMHHPTDVIAGALYGSCCLAVAVLVLAICSNSNRAHPIEGALP
jgi:undecaprenyl-diphosphatase